MYERVILLTKIEIIRDNCINVKMNSPICITKKAENDKVIFLSPQDKDFEEYINNNFYAYRVTQLIAPIPSPLGKVFTVFLSGGG